MKEAGIDTEIFKAHSVRGASSTAAAEKGFLMTNILWTADWSKDSTFKRFYYRPTSTYSYAQIMLQQRERREDGKTSECAGFCAICHTGLCAMQCIPTVVSC